MVRQQQVVASYCIAQWESFLSNSQYFYEIATPNTAETLVFHILRFFYNILHSSIGKLRNVSLILAEQNYEEDTHYITYITFTLRRFMFQFLQHQLNTIPPRITKYNNKDKRKDNFCSRSTIIDRDITDHVYPRPLFKRLIHISNSHNGFQEKEFKYELCTIQNFWGFMDILEAIP